MSEDPRFSAQEFATLLAWYMVSDPWPLTERAQDRVEAMLEEEAEARGYGGWVDAYHDFHGEEVDDDV